MSDIYQITITTTNKETFTGKMTHKQPELVNDYVALAQGNGEWRFFKPESIEQFHFVPVVEETAKE